MVQRRTDKKRDHEPVDQGSDPIDQTLIVHHLPKSFGRHTHGAQHGKFLAAEHQIRGDRMEYIRHRDQRYQYHESISQHLDCNDRIPVRLICFPLILQITDLIQLTLIKLRFQLLKRLRRILALYSIDRA